MPNKTHTAINYNNGNFSEVNDVLAVEESLSIAINGEPFTVTMRTPGFETELILGVLYTEAVFRDSDFIPEIVSLKKNSDGYITEVDVQIPSDKILKDFAGSRNLISASSCGLCGRTDFEETISINIVSENFLMNPALFEKMFLQMSNAQNNFKQSGGTHAAAAFDVNGKMLDVFEDIGRHNAVDKLIGSLIKKNILSNAKVVTVSGRVSYEIVNKVRAAQIPILSAVSAPSTMAVKNADDAGLTLIAFCRNKKLTIYSHPERIAQESVIENNK